MNRQNLFADAPWDVEEPDSRRRIFWRPDDARMGATLYELAPGYDGDRVHMHYGAEEMFFVLSGRPVFRNLDDLGSGNGHSFLQTKRINFLTIDGELLASGDLEVATLQSYFKQVS